MRKAAFLDRDGTINVEKHYLYHVGDFEFLPGAVEGMKLLQQGGYSLFIITNQSGIARGYYTEESLKVLNDWLLNRMMDDGVRIEQIYYCPHHPQAIVSKYRMECSCRKPGLELFYRAAREYHISIDSSVVIGDKMRDLWICSESGCRGFLVGTTEDDNNISKVKNGDFKNIAYCADLRQAADRIVGKEAF